MKTKFKKLLMAMTTAMMFMVLLAPTVFAGGISSDANAQSGSTLSKVSGIFKNISIILAIVVIIAIGIAYVIYQKKNKNK